MPLTQAQIVTIQRSASLEQAQLYAKSWGVSDQQLADILRTSTIGTLLPNIEKQHLEAGTPVPKQATEFRKLVESHPQETKYDIRGAVKGTKRKVSKVGGKIEYGAEVKLEQPTVIQATAGELRRVSNDQAKLAAGETCPGGVSRISLYSVTTRSGEEIYVYSLNTLGAEGAEQKAEKAGYKVAWVRNVPSGKVPAEISESPISGIDKYKDSQGNYDIIGIANALRTRLGGVNDSEVRRLFGSKGYHDIVVVRDILTKLEPYKTGNGYLLSAALADRAVSTYEVGKIFSQSVVDNAISNRGAAASLSRYKDTNGNYDLIAISTALQSGRIKEETINSVLGIDATDAARGIGKIITKMEPYKSGNDYFLTDALANGAITTAEARQLFSDETVSEATGSIALSKALAEQREIFGGAESTVSGKSTKPYTTIPRTAFPVKEAALIAADIVVPYVYVIRHWDKLPVWEKALWITLDTVLFIIPMVGAGVRGARGVAVAAKEVGKLARVGAAIKNIGREAFVIVKAPVEAILHPVAATKQAAKDFRSVVENVVRSKKIPEAVLTTTEGTVRLSITNATSVEQFMAARDELIRLAARGQKPIVQLRDKAGKVIATLELQKAPLMRELKGGVVHTTPWGEQFRAGLTVEARVNMPLAEQGLFVSHEPLPRFATQSAFNLPVEIGQQGRGVQAITTRFGANQVATIYLQRQLSEETIQALAKAKLIQTGDNLIQPLSSKNVTRLVQTLRGSGNAKVAQAFEETVSSYKPIFRIMDPDKAKEIIASGKTYRGGVEMEAKLPIGAKIEPPKQILVTRIGPESTEVQLWLDKALSTRQIMKLKAEGLLEVFRQPFRFPLKIKGKLGTLSPAQVDDLARTMREVGNPEVARNLERAYQLTQSAKRMAQITAKAATAVVTRAPERLAAITRAEGVQLVRGIEWLERSESPEQLIRTRSGRVIRRPERVSRTERISRAERERRTERITRTERLERVARAERIPRAERPVRGERIERVERPIRGERPVRPTRPERPVRPVRPIRPTKPAKRFLLEPVKGKQKKIREGPALAVWKQGAYWVSIFPPFRTTGKKEDVVYSREKPPWGAVIARGRHSPRVTLRSIGKVPKLIEVPMGVVTARIRNGRKLTFSRRNGRRRGRVIE